MLSIETVSLALETVALYLAAGLVFGLAFLIFGLPRIDPAARGTGLAFRLIILPGVAALWPLLLARWINTYRAARGAA